ncbi:hypothetical protein SDC9_84473 [bioreactor metagenome]|uniref:Uncharacterized protein n=1 Tax=bioreactor metagenome TaxID=1076179 RepID=A0A644ZJB2_9ZZZZ
MPPGEQRGARVGLARLVGVDQQGVTGPVGQLGRDGHLDGDQQITLGAVLADDTAPADPQRTPVRRPGGDPQPDVLPVQGRHLDLGTQRGLAEGHRNGDGEVGAAAAEELVRGDVDVDVEVTGAAAVLTLGALALQPDPLAVLDPGRDADLHGVGRTTTPGTAADRARVVDDQPTAVAVLAGLGDLEDATRGGRTHPRALTGRADPRHGAGPRAGARTSRTGRVGDHLHGHRGALDGLVEVDRHVALDIGPPARAAAGRPADAATAPTEQATEQVGEVTGAGGGVAEQVVDVRRGLPLAAVEPEAAPEQAALLVVLLALLGVRQDVVGLRDGLEPLRLVGVARVGVGVVLARQLAEGLLDVVLGGVLRDAQDLVVVLLEPVLRAHRRGLSSVVAGFTVLAYCARTRLLLAYSSARMLVLTAARMLAGSGVPGVCVHGVCSGSLPG